MSLVNQQLEEGSSVKLLHEDFHVDEQVSLRLGFSYF
jgi:hypothetical protein